MYAAIENTFVKSKSTVNDKIATLKLAVVGSFLFGYRLNQEDIFSWLHNIKSMFLLKSNFNTIFSATQHLQSGLSKLRSIHTLGTVVNANFIMKVINMALLEKDTEFNLFIYDSILSEKDAFAIGNFIKFINISGVFLIICKSKIQGIIDTCSLNNELSNLEILNLIATMRTLCYYSSSFTTSWREDLQFYGNKSEAIIQSFIDFLYKMTSSCYLTICLVEGHTLIAHNVRYETIYKIEVSLTSLYLRNCCLNTSQYKKITTTFKQISKLYVINGQLTSDICILLNIQELFLHTVTSDLYDLSTWFSNHRNGSSVIITQDEVALHNPTSEQLALVLRLNPSISKWSLYICQLSPEIYYQLVAILTSTSIKTISEIKIFHTDIGIVECEALLEYILKTNTSVSKLSLTLSRTSTLSIHLVPTFVHIILTWNIEVLSVSFHVSQQQFFKCLIRKFREKFLISECHRDSWLETWFSCTIKINKKAIK